MPTQRIDSTKPVIHVAVRSVSFGSGRGGLERAAGMHIRLMAERNLSVVLHTDPRHVSGDVPTGVDLAPVYWPVSAPVLAKALSGPAYVIWCQRVAKSLLNVSKGPTIWHLHGAASGVLRLAGKHHPPTVVHTHGMEEFGPLSLKTFPTRPFIRYLARAGARAEVLISTDPSLTPMVLRHMRVPEPKIRLVPNGVDVAALQALASQGASLRTAALAFVSVGRVVPNKGYDLWLEALVRLERSGDLPSNWEWIHFGSGTELAKLARRARQGLGGHVRFVERADDRTVQATLAAADLFVQPSRYEGSSLTVLEAMAHGVPVLGTPVGGIPDKVTDGKTGFLAKTATSQALADAARRALSAEDLREIGRAGQVWASAHRSAATIAEGYLEIYAHLRTLPA